MAGYVCPDFEHRPRFGDPMPQEPGACHCGKTLAQVPEWGRPQVLIDIEPYTSMVTGERIAGRRQHRDHLRAHGLVEVGNERPPPPPQVDASWVKPAIREEYNRMKFQGRI